MTKRLRDANGIHIGVANENPFLDTRAYEVEYTDVQKATFSANTIATNMFAQVDEEGNQYDLLDEIVDHRTDGSEVMPDNEFVNSKNSGHHKHDTNKGWEILPQWNDSSTT